jgi:DNA-binding CsgD family transcriptional regulator
VPNPAPEQKARIEEAPAAAGRVGRLSAGQLDCLRLVNEHLNSKEIAAELGISPHTVDQRIRGALQILGVERRSQAARIVAHHAQPYQRLIHQSPHIEPAPDPADQGGTVSNEIRQAGRVGETRRNAGFKTEQRSEFRGSSLQLPFATRSHPRNEMSVGVRLLWILVIATGAAFSAGMYLAGLESLSRLLQG